MSTTPTDSASVASRVVPVSVPEPDPPLPLPDPPLPAPDPPLAVADRRRFRRRRTRRCRCRRLPLPPLPNGSPQPNWPIGLDPDAAVPLPVTAWLPTASPIATPPESDGQRQRAGHRDLRLAPVPRPGRRPAGADRGGPVGDIGWPDCCSADSGLGLLLRRLGRCSAGGLGGRRDGAVRVLALLLFHVCLLVGGVSLCWRPRNSRIRAAAVRWPGVRCEARRPVSAASPNVRLDRT